MQTADVHLLDDDTQLTWGHALLTPEGEEIRLPQYAFRQLRQLGLLQRNRERGLLQITSLVYEFMRPEYSGLLGALRSILGEDDLQFLTGPTVVDCRCKPCKRERRQIARNLMPDWKALVDQARPGLHVDGIDY